MKNVLVELNESSAVIRGITSENAGLTINLQDGTQVTFNVKSKEEFIKWFEENNKKINKLNKQLGEYEAKLNKYETTWKDDWGCIHQEPWEERYDRQCKRLVEYEDKYNELMYRIRTFRNKNVFKRIICAIRKDI